MVRKSVVLSTKPHICSSFFAKGTGLTFRFPHYTFAYIFPFPNLRKVQITMWFVFITIDLISLDDAGKIIELRESLKPFGFYFLQQKAKTIIELPKGSIKEHSMKLGMFVSWSQDEVVLN